MTPIKAYNETNNSELNVIQMSSENKQNFSYTHSLSLSLSLCVFLITLCVCARDSFLVFALRCGRQCEFEVYATVLRFRVLI